MLNRILTSISSVGNQGAPSSFKFVIGEKIEVPSSFYDLYNARAKNGIINIPGIPIPDLSSVDVSVFIYRKSESASLSLNALKKLVSLRHPSILRVLDSAESESAVFIATEFVRPLSLLPRSQEIPIHGIYQLAKAIEFVHNDAKLFHGSIDPVNVFVTSSGSFRLGGFELARPSIDTNFNYDKRNCNSGIFRRIDTRDLDDVDSVGFLLVVSFLVNGPSLPVREGSGVSVSTLGESLCRTAASDSTILNLISEISRTRRITSKSTCFASNETVQILEYLETIHVRGDEAIKFLDSLPNRLGRVSKSFQQGVLIETLLGSVFSISSLVPSAIPALIDIGSRMAKDEFIIKVQPKLVELFAIQDRGIRFRLLAGLQSFVSLIDPSVLEKSILIEMLSGFTDSHPSIREQTLKGVVEVASRVSQPIVEKRILTHLNKLLKDPESNIRTNAIRSISTLVTNKDDGFLGFAISSGLADQCASVKLASLEILSTFKVNSDLKAQEISSKFLPLVCPLITDVDGQVANSAFEVLQSLLDKIKLYIPKKAPATPPVTEVKLSAVSSSSRQKGLNLNNRKDTSAFDSFWDDIAKPPVADWNSNNSLI